MNRIFTLLILAAFSNTQVSAQCNPDTEPPVVVAMNGLNVSIMPTKMVALWATDLLSGVQDNCTPENQIQLGLRKAGEGTGFPLNPDGSPQIVVTYFCCQFGTQIVELWARDAAGNSSVDSAYLVVQDITGGCGCFEATISGCAYSPSEKVISEVYWELTGNHPALPPANIFQVKDCMELNGIPLLGDYSITPGKSDDPLNGVSTFDLLKISKHILGLEPLANPYQIIAADANNSRSITTFDIIELRKLILGIYSELPNNQSYRFIPKGFQFQNPTNPFAEVFPEKIEIQALQASTDHIDFTGIKIGDINGNALDDSLQTGSEDRSALHFLINDALLRPGETLRIPLRLETEQSLLGIQFALAFDPTLLEISGAVLSERLTLSQPLTAPEAYFAEATPGQFRFSWNSPQRAVLPAGDAVLFLEIKAKQALQLSRTLRLQTAPLLPELYPNDGTIRPLKFEFLAAPKISQSEVFSAVPNPSAAAVQIPLTLAEASTVQLELFDSNGRLLYRVEQELGTGLQQVNIPAAAMAGKGRVLVYRLMVGERLFSGKLLRID